MYMHEEEEAKGIKQDFQRKAITLRSRVVW
jgi:hypothetical protein